jgi:ADP/ATP carrier protein family
MQSVDDFPKNFGVIRKIIWPIKNSELPRFVPMASLLFMIWLNHNIVRSIKDGLVVTQVGPEVISFIKLWIEMPLGIVFILIYTKMCNIMTTERVFRYIVTFFLCFFTLFAFLIYPNQDLLHPSPHLVESYKELFPHFKWFFVIWGKWSFTMYYVMGELWPIVVSTLLFWQLANKITKTSEAARFYSFFCLFGQVSLVIAGIIIKFASANTDLFMKIFFCNSKDESILKFFSSIEFLTGISILFIHRFIEVNIVEKTNSVKKFKVKRELRLGMLEGLNRIRKSKYLGLIAILVISYSTTVNLIEGLWFSKVKEFYPSLSDFMNYQGTVLSCTGMFAIICAILGSTIIRKFGWFWSAVATPLMIMISGTIMFVAIFMQYSLSPLLIFFGFTYLTPLGIVAFVGGLQNVLGKGVKYSLFDSTKEMVYIPLDAENKTKGKAAVDVIGSKLGKSTGAIIQFGVFTMFPGALYNDIVVILLVAFLIVSFIWIYGVKALSKSYSEILEKGKSL